MNLLNVRKNLLGLVCLIVTSAILLAGLWPFNFSPENKVRWLKDQNGIQFYGPAIIFSQLPAPYPLHPTPYPLHPTPYPLPPFSLELFLQSTTQDSSHIGHIVSTVDDKGSEIFFVGQWRSHLILGKGIHGKANYREIGVRDVLKKGDKRFVTITSGAEGTNIYVDGILLKSSPRFQLFSMNEKPSGRIVLGNSPTGDEYWTGNLLSLAIYDRVLTGEEVHQHFPQNFDSPKKSEEKGFISLYLFNERSGTLATDHVGGHHLLIPSTFEVLQKIILVPPWKDFRLSRSYFLDILTNILGFVPFGFFFSAYLRLRKPYSTYRTLLISVLMAGCISLSIELIQVYLPSRNSQLTDMITNTLGTLIGVILFLNHHKKLTRNL